MRAPKFQYRLSPFQIALTGYVDKLAVVLCDIRQIHIDRCETDIPRVKTSALKDLFRVIGLAPNLCALRQIPYDLIPHEFLVCDQYTRARNTHPRNRKDFKKQYEPG